MAIVAADVVKGLLGAVATSAGVNPFFKWLLDSAIFPGLLKDWLFPTPAEDLFRVLESRITELVDKRVEAAVGAAAFERVKADLQGLGATFADYANVVDLDERRYRLAVLLVQADISAASVEAVPDRYLYLLTDALVVIAVAHTAALLDQVQQHPERYENQIALDTAAIRYSELAGRLRDRFLWYRMGQIARGVGEVMEKEIDRRPSATGEKKIVRFSAYDDMALWWMSPNKYRTEFLGGLETGWVQAIGMEPAYFEKKQEAAARVVAYGDEQKQKVYDWWGEHLTNHTQELLKLVDWKGRQSERKPRDRTVVRAWPLGRVVAPDASATALDRIDLFLAQQMDTFSVSGPRYIQTYRVPGEPRVGTQSNLFYRADTYDTAVASIYFAARGDLRRAGDLADGLCIALEHDPIGGGRIVAATHATALLDRAEGYATSIFPADGATRDVGNACWAGIALTRMYAATRQYRYLHHASSIAWWVYTEHASKDAWQGYTGGEDAWGQKRAWRSVEHNVDAFALFTNLYRLTREERWVAAAQRAQRLVKACHMPEGYYVTGTGVGDVLNAGVVPADVQTWTALAGLNPAGNASSLRFLLDRLSTTTAGFAGFKFALAGEGVQNEVTAGAAMALHLMGGDLREGAEPYFDSLVRQQLQAPGTVGAGLVATPGAEAKTGEGLGWSYFNWPHAASSAWTGLALLARDDARANPYAPVG
ncbi:hypothetical protein [Archangium lipolyticum]|uniref:hypothetical protein n=1 Tax=Archangium lipolyticum TaxID=2970465 RepID=UPI00214A0F17|nr:hypothetical protein [Archangium lipolyticum]